MRNTLPTPPISGTKYELLASKLEHQVATSKFNAGQPVPSIRTLMRSNRLSMRTVVRGLKLLEKRGVLDRHHRRGYFVADRGRPHPAIKQIAFVTPTLDSDTNTFLKGTAEVLMPDRIPLATYSTHGELKRMQMLLEQVAQVRPAGLIMHTVPEYLFTFDYAALITAGIPMVVIGPAVTGLNCDRVFHSGRESGRKIARYLLNRGCRDFAMLTSNPPDDPDGACTGVQMELRHAGMELTEDRVFFCNPAHGFSNHPDPYIDGRKTMERLLAEGLRFKTLVCCHDYPAVGALRAIAAARLRVPQDVAVASALRLGVEGATPLKLTTIDSHREEQAHVATELLLRRIEGYDGLPEVHYVRGELNQGETA